MAKDSLFGNMNNNTTFIWFANLRQYDYNFNVTC